jgi:hypothetical protein
VACEKEKYQQPKEKKFACHIPPQAKGFGVQKFKACNSLLIFKG